MSESSDPRASSQTRFELSSPMGIDLRVWLKHEPPQNPDKASSLMLDDEDMSALHLTLTGTVRSQDCSPTSLSQDHLWAIVVPLMDDINSVSQSDSLSTSLQRTMSSSR